MPSKLLRILLCCSPSSANDEPFLHANRPITVATPAVTLSPPSSTRRLPPPPPPPATNPSPRSSPPATIRPSSLSRRRPSSHYPSSCYSRETSSPGPPTSSPGPPTAAATKYPSWYTKSDTVRKMALGPWHPENLRVEFADGCAAGAKGQGKSIYRLPERG